MSSVNELVASEYRAPEWSKGVLLPLVSDIISEIEKTNITCEYVLDEEQKKVLFSFFRNKIVYVPKFNVDHPVLNFCGQQFKKEIMNTVMKQKVIILLGSTYKELKSVILDQRWDATKLLMGVMGVHDDRDWMRIEDGYIQACSDISDPNKSLANLAEDYLTFYKNLHDKVNKPTKFFSTKFSCWSLKLKAQVIFAFESIYDMTKNMLYAYLVHFNAVKVMTTVITCVELLNSDSYYDTDFEVDFERYREKISMRHRGASLGYIHSYKTFMEWTLHSRFEFETETMLAERVKTLGSYSLMNVYRVPKANTAIIRTIPNARDKWVQLFDVAEWMETREKVHFYVQKEKWAAVYRFALRQQTEQFDPAKIAAFAHSKIDSLSFNGVTVSAAWKADLITIDRTIQCAIMASTFTRGKNYKILLRSLYSSKREGLVKDFIKGPISAWFEKTYKTLVNNAVGEFFGLDVTKVLEAIQPWFTTVLPVERLLFNYNDSYVPLEQIPDLPQGLDLGAGDDLPQIADPEVSKAIQSNLSRWVETSPEQSDDEDDDSSPVQEESTYDYIPFELPPLPAPIPSPALPVKPVPDEVKESKPDIEYVDDPIDFGEFLGADDFKMSDVIHVELVKKEEIKAPSIEILPKDLPDDLPPPPPFAPAPVDRGVIQVLGGVMKPKPSIAVLNIKELPVCRDSETSSTTSTSTASTCTSADHCCKLHYGHDAKYSEYGVVVKLDPNDQGLKYSRRTGEDKPMVHWGQRKLLIMELFFCSLLKVETVIYIGAAPGNHLNFLAGEFPKLQFICFDPKPFAKIDKRNVAIVEREFTIKDAQHYANIQVALICDLRTCELEDDQKKIEAAIAKDNAFQNEIVLKMQPVHCMLKKRLQYATEKVQFEDFIKGRTFFQPWTGPTSTETRLIASSPYKLEKLDVRKYESQLYRHNIIDRKMIYGAETQLQHHDDCYDCCLEEWYIKEVIRLLPHKTSLIGYISRIDAFFEPRNLCNLDKDEVKREAIKKRLDAPKPEEAQFDKPTPMIMKAVNRTLEARSYPRTYVNEIKVRGGKFKMPKEVAVKQASGYANQMKLFRDAEKFGDLTTLADVHDKCAKEADKAASILKSRTQDLEVECEVWDCAAGSGKTTAITSIFNNLTDCYIVSTNEGRSDVTAKMQAKNPKVKDWDIWTYETALSDDKKNIGCKKRIFLDECFTLPMAYIVTLMAVYPKAHFILAGDINQMQYFDDKSAIQWSCISSYLSCFGNIYTINKTRRCGASIARLINAVVPGYKMKSITDHDTRIHWVNKDSYDRGLLPQVDIMMAPSKDTAACVNSVRTVRSVQGLDANSAAIILRSNDLPLFNTPEVFIVSMTRAIKDLYIVDADGNISSRLPIDFSVILDTIKPYVPSDVAFVNGKVSSDYLVTSDATPTSNDFSADMVIDSFMPKMLDNNEAAVRVDLPTFKPVTKPFSFNPDYLQEIKEYKYVTLSRHLRGRSYRVSSGKQTMASFMKRANTKNKMKITPDQMSKGLKNFKEMYFKKEFETINFESMFQNAARAIVEKYNQSVSKDFQLESRPDQAIGHLKTIVKVYIDETEKVASGKAGQPIVAWSGKWNLIFGPFFRTLSEAMRMMTNDRTVFANGYTEAEMDAAMRRLSSATRKPNAKWDMNDFTEYGESQSESSSAFETKMIKEVLNLSFGPEFECLADVFKVMKDNIVIFSGPYVADNDKMNTSGNPGTFFFNTLLEMGLFAIVLKPHEYLAGAFGGDDSLILNTVTDKDQKKRWLLLNIEIKYLCKRIPIFFNQFFDPLDGAMAYDPLRLMTTIVTKNLFRQTEAETLAYIKQLQLAVAQKKTQLTTNRAVVYKGMWDHYKFVEDQTDQLLEQLWKFTQTPAESILAQVHAYTIEF